MSDITKEIMDEIQEEFDNEFEEMEAAEQIKPVKKAPRKSSQSGHEGHTNTCNSCDEWTLIVRLVESFCAITENPTMSRRLNPTTFNKMVNNQLEVLNKLLKGYYG